jgi:anaerobic selenocysteine-containing dehydrogenase
MCGLTLQVSGDRVLGVRGDPEDAFSRGYMCPKAVGLIDVHHDPDRIGRPLRRRGGSWEPAGWDDAVSESVSRLAAIRRVHGNDAVAFYVGNPATHSYSATLAALAFAGSSSVPSPRRPGAAGTSRSLPRAPRRPSGGAP